MADEISTTENEPDEGTPPDRESTRKNRPWWAKLVLLFVVVVFGLLALEVAVRVVFSRQGMHYGIEMWRYAKLLKRASSDRELGHEHIPASRATLMGVDVQINSLGLRNSEVATEKPSDVFRILIVGDSMTFGWGAAERDTYSRVLEANLSRHRDLTAGKRVEVINAGVGNYNTVQEVRYLTTRGMQLRPDLIILGYYINDAEPTPKRTRGWIAEHSYLYVLGSSAWDGFERKMGWRQDWTTYYRHLYDADQPGWRACQASLERLVKVVRQNNVPTLVVLIPELHFTGAGYPFSTVHNQVLGRLQGLGLKALDLRRAFQDVKDPKSLWVSPGDAHPNARAHKIIADAIFEHLDQTSLLRK